MNLKDAIRKNYGPQIHSVSDAIRIDWCFDLYAKLIHFDLKNESYDSVDGLNSKLEFLENYLVKDNYQGYENYLIKFEVFVKKLYFVLDSFGLIEESISLDFVDNKPTLSHYLTVLNRIKKKDDRKLHKVKNFNKVHLGSYFLVKAKEKLVIAKDNNNVSEIISIEKEIEKLNKRYTNGGVPMFGHLIDSVVLKNQSSHIGQDFTIGERFKYIGNILISELYLVYFFQEELEKSFRLESSNSELAQEYVQSRIEQLRHEQNRYVPLLLKNINDSNVDEEFLNNIFQKHPQFQIIGKGGNGKTTSLKHLFFKCLEEFRKKETEILPIFLNLSRIKHNSTVVSELAGLLSIKEDEIKEMLTNNQLLLFLDGLNEIHSAVDIERVIHEINEINEEFTELRIILSSREDSDPQINNYFNFPIFQIQPLKEDQFKEFVNKYCDEKEDVAQNVFKVIDNQPSHLKTLFKKPLLLSRAIEVCKERSKLPETEYGIIKAFIQRLLKREKEEKMDPKLDVSFFILIFSNVASEINKQYGLTNYPISKYKFIMFITNSAKELGYGISNEGMMSSDYIFRISYELEIISFENDDDVKFFHQSYLSFFNSTYMKNQLG